MPAPAAGIYVFDRCSRWKTWMAGTSPAMTLTDASIQHRVATAVAPGGVFLEDFRHLRVSQRFAGVVGQEVLLRHVGDVFRFRVLRIQMIEWLVLAWAA